ncbi:MAG: sarcosine oxidase subunit delta [Polaromonas sp.]|nr:sarcosine oxidase subunit delta [Polaromonas sp.]
MLIISCPHCGDRNESEFQHGGPVRIRRPDSPGKLEDAAWVDYLTVPNNPMGPVEEKWWHVRGCGAWLIVRRDTVTHAIVSKASHDE